MNKKLLIFPLLVLAFAFIVNTNAITTPPGVINSISINIINTQNTQTPIGFQQSFNSLPFNALVGNVLVFNGISGSTMPAWVENSSLMWVNFESNTIGATSSANGIYYFGFGGANTNFFISGNNIGEAPQLSPSYAQYDNGNVLFPNYWNFNTINGWDSTGNNIVVNNGLSLGVNSDIFYANSFNANSIMLDWFGKIEGVGSHVGFSSNSNSDPLLSPLSFGNSLIFDVGIYYPYDISTGNPSGGGCGLPGGVFSSFSDITQNAIYTLIFGNPTSIGLKYYKNSVSIGDCGYISSPSIVPGIDINSKSNDIFVQWMRIRNQPPNDIMPTLTYGITTTSTSTSTTTIPSCGISPTGVTSCIPLNITNNQSVSTPANFIQPVKNIAIDLTKGNVLVYNGLSGATMPTWIENQSILWINLKANTIGATSSANGVYYIGIGAPSANFLISGNNIGIASQFYGSANDNGNTVFPYYCSFYGLASLPTCGGQTWLATVGTNVVFGTNSVHITTNSIFSNSNNGIYTNSPSVGNVIGYTTYAYMSTQKPGNTSTYGTKIGYVAGVPAGVPTLYLGYEQGSFSLAKSVQNTQNSIALTGAGSTSLLGFAYSNSFSTGTFFINLTNVGNFSHSGSNRGRYLSFYTSNHLASSNIYYTFTAPSFPNGIIPLVTLLNPTISPLPVSTYTQVDAGQTVTFTTNVVGGNPNYNYQWEVFNSVTNTILNTTIYSNVPSSSNTFVFTVNSALEWNTIYANVLVTDSGLSVGQNSTKSETFTVNPPLEARVPIPTNPTIDLGQNVILTANPFWGSPSYTYQWYSLAGTTAPTCTSANAIGGQTGVTYTVAPSSATSYSYLVTDNSTTPVSQCSTGSTIHINSALGTPSISSSANSINGQSITFSTSVSGGTGNYLYVWRVFNSITSAPITFIANVPITITNNNPASTPVNYTQYMTLNALTVKNYLNGSLTNTQFTYYNGTPITCWFAGNQSNYSQQTNLNTTNSLETYCKITPQIAGSGGTLTILWQFAPMRYDLMDKISTIGKAPELSTSYGKNDNGGNIFAFYDNFSSLTQFNKRWTHHPQGYASPNNFTYIVNNGIAVKQLSCANTIIFVPPPSQFNNVGNCAGYFYSPFSFLSTNLNVSIDMLKKINTTSLGNGGVDMGYGWIASSYGTRNPFSELARNTYNIQDNFNSVGQRVTKAINGDVLNLGNTLTYSYPINTLFLSGLNITTANSLTGYIRSNVNANTGQIHDTSFGVAVLNQIAFGRSANNTVSNLETDYFVRAMVLGGNTPLGTSMGALTTVNTIINEPTVTLYNKTSYTSASNSNSFIFQTNSLKGNLLQTNISIIQANVTVTDSAFQPETTNSIKTGINIYSFNSLLSSKTTYKTSSNTILTSNVLYNLLNFSYNINVTSAFKINTISINFGTNSLPSNQIISVNSLTYNSVIWNVYQNNNITSYNAVVTIKDILGDITSFNTVISTNTYIIPKITSPQIFLTSTPTSYTYTNIKTPISANVILGSFPQNNLVTYLFGNNAIATFNNMPNSIYANAINIYSTVTNSLTINDMITDINGFSSSNSVIGLQVLTYNPGTVTLTDNVIYTVVNFSHPFSVIAGTFTINSVNVYWGDGSNTLYTFNSPVSSGTFSLHHMYTSPQTYILSAYSTDTSPLGGIATQTLTNPIVVVKPYIYPIVSQVLPSNRFNGANDNTENFTFYLQEGDAALKNLTINWNDATSIGNNKTTTHTTLTASQLTYTIQHTFVFPISYPTNVTICDINKVCATYATTITIGDKPLSQQGVNQIQNSSALAYNQSKLYKNQTYIGTQNPTYDIVGFLIIGTIVATSIALLWRSSKKRVKR